MKIAIVSILINKGLAFNYETASSLNFVIHVIGNRDIRCYKSIKKSGW
jgi:hypothetical protein